MADERGVHPDCRNASNPYHECSEYCFKIIAEAKAQMEQREPGCVSSLFVLLPFASIEVTVVVLLA